MSLLQHLVGKSVHLHLLSSAEELKSDPPLSRDMTYTPPTGSASGYPFDEVSPVATRTWLRFRAMAINEDNNVQDTSQELKDKCTGIYASPESLLCNNNSK